MSESKPGEPVAGAFPHLVSAYPETRFSSRAEVRRILCETPAAALFSAAPHGVSAALVDGLLGAAEQAGTQPRVVDLSADFRYRSAQAYTEVYDHAHGAPRPAARSSAARCPEHLERLATPHVAHPGLLRHRDPAGERAAAGRWAHHPGPVRERRHRQHRLGSQAGATARTTRCGTAICTATARSPTATCRRSPPARAPRAASRRSSPSSRTRVRSRAASTSRCRRPSRVPSTPRACWACCGSTTPARRSCA